MRHQPALLLFCMLFMFSQCEEQTEPDPVINPIYEGCCGAKPVEYDQSGVYMYVPNVFTPNGDGVNDYFVPYVNTDTLGFDSYLIYTMEGDTSLFSQGGFSYAGVSTYAWGGNYPDGKPYIGPFRYEFNIFKSNGQLVTIKGIACRIECGPDAAMFKTMEGCFYPNQASPDRKLDKSLPNKETGCFE